MFFRILQINILLLFSSLAAVEKPNILFIVSEDNSEHLGCYGEEKVHTPHLDSLAATGVLYENAYVPYSVCSPSRAAFLTGLYPRMTGHIGLATHKFSMYRKFKTMPKYFKEAGYYTGFIGKVHVNPESTVVDYVEYQAIKNSNFSKTISIEAYAKEAKKVMQKSKDADKPFLLIMNYPDAHRKFVGKSKNGFPTKMENDPIKPFSWIGSDSEHLREEIKNYFNCMNRLDEGVGMVLEELRNEKLRENTLIIYISDHGADFPRGKATVYEHGVKIPMIVNYPKLFSKGKREEGFVSSMDVLPTMLGVAGVSIPTQLNGNSLLELDRGKIKGRKYIHTFTTGSAPPILFLQFGIRDDRFKLIYNPSREQNLLAVSRYKNSKLPNEEQLQSFLYPDEYELYDLKNDKDEWENLAMNPEYDEIKRKLMNEMLAFQKSIKDPFVKSENVDKFIQEQKKYQNVKYKGVKGFRWPHLDLYKEEVAPHE